MFEPEDIVTAIFVLAVGAVVTVTLLIGGTGGDVSGISQLVGDFALPFLLLMIVLYIALVVIQNVQ